jgi:hypothetical protein
MSLVGSKTHLTALKSGFRFAPENGLNPDIAPCLKSANSGSHPHATARPLYLEKQVLLSRQQPNGSPREIPRHHCAEGAKQREHCK